MRPTLRRIILAFSGTVIFIPASHAEVADDAVLWPNHGDFPAYPRDVSGRPVSAYVSADIGVDDNLFRLSDTTDSAVLAAAGGRADKFAKLGGGVRGELEFSRQQLRFDANAEHYSFDRFSTLNKWIYGGTADWLWTAGDRFKGVVGYAYDRDLPKFADLQAPSNDVLTHRYGHAGIHWRVVPKLELRALAEGAQYDHEDITRAELDNRVKSGTAGLVYVGATETAVGVQYKASQGDYPNLQRVGTLLIDNDYRETESSAIISKDFDTRIGTSIRVGYTERRHESLAAQRDFNGTTGRAQLRYAPSAKVLLRFAAYRELQAIEDLSASYALVRGGEFGPAWAPTDKMVFQASYIYEERTFNGSPVVAVVTVPAVAVIAREDRGSIARVAAGYRPGNHFEVVLSYEHGNRSANVATFDYEYNLGTLHLIATF